MHTIIFCSVVFGVTSKLPIINKIHWCVALHRPSPAINKCRCLTLLHHRNVDDTRWSSNHRC